jgi:hypothetical protein
MMLRTIREAVMRAQALPRAIPLDQVDLEALDRFLMSDRSPPNSMMLSDLDGFLVSIRREPQMACSGGLTAAFLEFLSGPARARVVAADLA